MEQAVLKGTAEAAPIRKYSLTQTTGAARLLIFARRRNEQSFRVADDGFSRWKKEKKKKRFLGSVLLKETGNPPRGFSVFFCFFQRCSRFFFFIFCSLHLFSRILLSLLFPAPVSFGSAAKPCFLDRLRVLFCRCFLFFYLVLVFFFAPRKYGKLWGSSFRLIDPASGVRKWRRLKRWILCLPPPQGVRGVACLSIYDYINLIFDLMYGGRQ